MILFSFSFLFGSRNFKRGGFIPFFFFSCLLIGFGDLSKLFLLFHYDEAPRKSAKEPKKLCRQG